MSKPAVLLTFDDGYVDFKEVVLPELQSRGLPCVLFPTMAPVRQGYVPPADQVYALLSADCRGQQLLTPEQRASWVSGVLKKTMLAAAPDEQGRMIAALADSLALPQALPAPIHMTEADLLQLPHNVYFGAHGLYHHEFGSLTDVELSDELQRILAWISWLRPEQAHGVWLAYPNGKANRSARPGVVTDAVHRAGVDFAFVASADPSIPEDSNFKIPRLFSHDDVGRFKHIWQPAL